ncbi:hypothetical protein LCGC14_2125110 [marine sediment metagenome]|uniref:Uncharacterized protein n=1 Tax=marine sediment metagenome TaxID=412755 RepID=A0A0F9GZC9_9ZZZZ
MSNISITEDGFDNRCNKINKSGPEIIAEMYVRTMYEYRRKDKLTWVERKA